MWWLFMYMPIPNLKKCQISRIYHFTSYKHLHQSLLIQLLIWKTYFTWQLLHYLNISFIILITSRGIQHFCSKMWCSYIGWDKIDSFYYLVHRFYLSILVTYHSCGSLTWCVSCCNPGSNLVWSVMCSLGDQILMSPDIGMSNLVWHWSLY